jgi:hypothetical protein
MAFGIRRPKWLGGGPPPPPPPPPTPAERAARDAETQRRNDAAAARRALDRLDELGTQVRRAHGRGFTELAEQLAAKHGLDPETGRPLPAPAGGPAPAYGPDPDLTADEPDWGARVDPPEVAGATGTRARSLREAGVSRRDVVKGGALLGGAVVGATWLGSAVFGGDEEPEKDVSKAPPGPPRLNQENGNTQTVLGSEMVPDIVGDPTKVRVSKNAGSLDAFVHAGDKPVGFRVATETNTLSFRPGYVQVISYDIQATRYQGAGDKVTGSVVVTLQEKDSKDNPDKSFPITFSPPKGVDKSWTVSAPERGGWDLRSPLTDWPWKDGDQTQTPIHSQTEIKKVGSKAADTFKSGNVRVTVVQSPGEKSVIMIYDGDAPKEAPPKLVFHAELGGLTTAEASVEADQSKTANSGVRLLSETSSNNNSMDVLTRLHSEDTAVVDEMARSINVEIASAREVALKDAGIGKDAQEFTPR